MTDRELMQMALDALEHGLPIIEDFGGKGNIELQHKAIAVLYEALRAALAQPEQEPVAWLYVVGESRYVHGHQIDEYYSLDGGETRIKGIPLYTAPPQREFIGLTDEEILEVRENCHKGMAYPQDAIVGPRMMKLAEGRAIEAKLREKNT